MSEEWIIKQNGREYFGKDWYSDICENDRWCENVRSFALFVAVLVNADIVEYNDIRSSANAYATRLKERDDAAN